jgi:hypothetical protein
MLRKSIRRLPVGHDIFNKPPAGSVRAVDIDRGVEFLYRVCALAGCKQ